MRTSTLTKRCIALSMPALLIVGCTVGPDYEKPNVPMPNDFRAQITPTDAGSFADLPWWSIFNDKALQNLINEALANNHDLEVAVARIEQTRTQVKQVESEGRPQIGYGASAMGEKTNKPQQKTNNTTTKNNKTGLLN